MDNVVAMGIGDGPDDLLFAGTTASNIETIWHLPEAARFFERLGTYRRVAEKGVGWSVGNTFSVIFPPRQA